MKRIIFLVFLTLIPLIICGQTTRRWAGKNHYIKPKPKNKDFIGRKIYVAKVIDKRVEQKYLGTVEKNDLIYMAKFEKPFEDAIQDIFVEMYPFKESYLPVTVFVNEFLIEEKAGKGITTVDLEFFLTDTTKSIIKIQQSHEVKGAKVTNKHRKVIADLLSDCFIKANTKSNELLVTKQVIAQDTLKLKLPLKKGIYNDYMRMVLQNTAPDVPITLVQRENDKMGRFEAKYLNRDRKKIKNAFAASDGRDVYLNARSMYKTFLMNNKRSYDVSPLVATNYYLQSQLYGRYLYFEDRVSSNLYQYMIGVLGTLMSMTKVGFVLDSKDGSIHMLTTEFLREITVDRPDIRSTYNASKKKLKDKKAIIKALNEAALD